MSTNELTADRVRDAYRFLSEQMDLFEQGYDVYPAMQQLVRALGEYAGASAVQAAKYDGADWDVRYRWACDESTVQPGTEAFLRSHADTLCGGTVLEIEYVNHTLLAMPVREQERLRAALLFLDADPQKTALLREIQLMLCNWLAYRMAKQDNFKHDDRVQKLLSGLGNDYTAVYVINLDTDEFETIINQKSNNVAKQKKQQDWTTYLHNYADTYVLPAYSEAMKETLNCKAIKRRFAEHNDLYFRFTTLPNEKDQTTFETHTVRQYSSGGRYAIAGFRCVDAIVEKERRYQQELDRAYQAAQRQLDMITASIPGGVKISNDDAVYSFKYVSKQYAAMLGYDSPEEFMQACGGSIAGIAHPDDLESGIAEALDQYSRSDSYAITYRMRCKDGSYKYIEDHGHKVRAADGTVEHWNLILDKNDLVRTTIELESARKAGEAKTNFLARMSHDIRTPLNGIIGLLEYGERHPDDIAMLQKNRARAHIAANHLLSLINDVLELNKLDDKNVTLVREPFDFRELMREVETIADMRAAEEGISLTMQLPPQQEHAVRVYGSPLHVQQIFINVISNAIKYNRPGGNVRCTVRGQEDAAGHLCYTVEVKDNGIGMSNEFIHKIFTPFTQESSDARSVYNGTGLGMSIVKNIVDRMHGIIQIDSKPGRGTTVTVQLPFDKAPDAPQAPTADPDGAVDLRGLRVLLVEDNELNMDIARYLLEDEGMTVTPAVNGKEAVDLFGDNPAGTYDVILMDVMMPIMDGLTAARKIRAMERMDAKTIPIFAMTANAFAEDCAEARKAGMNEHLAKPLDVQKLLHCLQKYCRKP